MEIREIALDDVHLGARLRQVDAAYVDLLAGSIAQHGQRTPIDVRARADGGYLLIAGAHRVAACRAAGLPTVLAIVSDVDDLTAQLIEVDENLMRHELTALDRAAFLARRKALYLAKFPEAKPGGPRQKKQKEFYLPLTPSFSKDSAKRLNLGRRWLDQLIELHERLAPTVAARLAGTRFADNASLLIAMSRLDADEQGPVADALLSGAAKTVTQAVAQMFGRAKPTLDPDDARYRDFVRDWSAGGEVMHEQVINFLRRQGYKISAPKNGG
jgi:ParB family chromosome partitioning protein